MVCNRCIKVVNDELNNLGLNPKEVKLGEIEFEEELQPQALQKIKSTLEENGFELLEDKQTQLIERIKALIIELVQDEKGINLKTNLSEYLSSALHTDYSALSNLFSSFEGITIEKYLILQRIEKAKELLLYDELTLSEISYRLNYSSVAHLSSQFKKVTGLTPSEFKKMLAPKRLPLDSVI
ncbi:HTH-type transcriptional regulator YesS [compost metagenome]